MQPTELVSNERIIVLQAQLGQWDNLNHLLVCVETRQAAIIDPFDGAFSVSYTHLTLPTNREV